MSSCFFLLEDDRRHLYTHEKEQNEQFLKKKSECLIPSLDFGNIIIILNDQKNDLEYYLGNFWKINIRMYLRVNKEAPSGKQPYNS